MFKLQTFRSIKCIKERQTSWKIRHKVSRPPFFNLSYTAAIYLFNFSVFSIDSIAVEVLAACSFFDKQVRNKCAVDAVVNSSQPISELSSSTAGLINWLSSSHCSSDMLHRVRKTMLLEVIELLSAVAMMAWSLLRFSIWVPISITCECVCCKRKSKLLRADGFLSLNLFNSFF